MVQPAGRRLEFYVVPQTVTSSRDGNYDHPTAHSVVENVDRDHHRWAAKGRLASDWLTEVDAIDLPRVP
jgi:hypothetical protein